MSKMNTAADRVRRQLVGATRGRDLYWGFTIGVFANLVTLYLIIQGGDLPQLAMTAAIVGIFVFVMINSFDCMDDFKANVDDMDEEEIHDVNEIGQELLDKQQRVQQLEEEHITKLKVNIGTQKSLD